MPEIRTVKIGVLCTGTALPRWQAHVIRHVLEVPCAEIVVLGSPGHFPPLGATNGGLRGRLGTRCLSLLTKDPIVLEDISDHLAHLPSVELNLNSSGQIDLDPLGQYSPDLVISLLPDQDHLDDRGTRNIPVWRFSFGGSPLFANGMPGLRHDYMSEASLKVTFGAPGKGSVSGQFPLRNSWDEATLDHVLMGASWLPAIAASAIGTGRSEMIQNTSSDDLNSVDHQISMISLAWTWSKLMIRQFGRNRNLEGAKPTPEWNIGILYQPITELLQEEGSMNVRWLPAPSSGNLRMEPFGYTAPDGQLNVLYRKNHRKIAHSEIARLRPKSDSVLKRSRTMLSTSADLQYPFVVERPNGAFAVISYPHQDRTELFRVADQNDSMEHITTLMNKALINPTLIEFEGRWWLFGTDPDAPDSVLLAYHAQNLEGPYRSHTLNPLKFSRSSTRPAGTPFIHEGQLWRPAIEDSTPGTHHVTLNRIIVLNPSEFEENIEKRIEGFPGTVYAGGIKTLCAMGDITLIDGIRSTRSEQRSSAERSSKNKGRRKLKVE